MAEIVKEDKEKMSTGDGDSNPPKKCGLWMSKKGRFCSSRALPSSLYCGNHRPSTEENRVACPIDSSHTILEVDVASHVRKCSAAKQLKYFQCQAYFCQGVNEGSDGEEDYSGPADVRNLKDGVNTSIQGDSYQSCGSKRAVITGLSGDMFWDFVKRIELAHDTCCQETEQVILQPSQCSKWWGPERDRRLPFQEKHISQQASLLGNLEAFGLLKAENGKADAERNNPLDDKKKWVYVEFGAGRGYLGHMLCDSYGVSSIVLVERRAYKFKDVTVQQECKNTEEGLPVDICACENMPKSNSYGSQLLYTRHLNLGLDVMRLLFLADQSSELYEADWLMLMAYGYLLHTSQVCIKKAVVVISDATVDIQADRTLRQILGVSVERLRTDIEDLKLQGVKSLQGRHYVAVSKHLCGPATDYGRYAVMLGARRWSLLEYLGFPPYISVRLHAMPVLIRAENGIFFTFLQFDSVLSTDLTLRCCLNRVPGNCAKASHFQDDITEPILEGIGIATCCHHLCQWRSYINKAFFRMLGFSVNDFNMLTWLTSWAVNQSEEHGQPEHEASMAEKPIRKGGLEIAEGAVRSKLHLSEAMDSLDLSARAALGRKCKDILDHGRLLWLKERGMEGKIVKYISPAVTPENKLLLACRARVQDESARSKPLL